MTEAAPSVAEAEAAAALARQRLSVSVSAVQARLKPDTLARNAARSVATGGAAATQAGLSTAKRHPGALAGLTALAGLLLARHRIGALFRRAPATRTKRTR